MSSTVVELEECDALFDECALSEECYAEEGLFGSDSEYGGVHSGEY